MATKKISDLQLRSDFDETCNVPVDDSAQTWRATGTQIKDFVVPFTALGDLLHGGAAGIKSILAGNTAAVRKMLNQTGNGSASAAPSWVEVKPPTVQKLLSGTGTYNTPANVLYLRVRMAGGGGGGGAATNGTALTNASTAGGASTFGSSLLTANGGGAGPSGVSANGGAGGTVTVSAPAVEVSSRSGGIGQGGSLHTSAIGASQLFMMGGSGGNNAFGGGAGGAGDATAGAAGVANSGGGGAGGGSSSVVNTTTVSGGGGGAGGYVESIITEPDSTYSFGVGAGGTGGNGGTNNIAGGAGGSGVIIVEEYYQ